MNKQSTTQSTTQTVADSQPDPDSTVPLFAYDNERTDRARQSWSRQLVAGNNNGTCRIYAICNADSAKVPDRFRVQASTPRGPMWSNVAFGQFETSLS